MTVLRRLWRNFVRSLLSMLVGLTVFAFVLFSAWLGQLSHVVKPFYWDSARVGASVAGLIAVVLTYIDMSSEEEEGDES